VLGDIQAVIGNKKISLELKWSMKPESSFRYFGPRSDKSLFGEADANGDTPYIAFLKSHHYDTVHTFFDYK